MHRSARRLQALLLLLGLTLAGMTAACGESEESAASALVERDSAGVAIVEIPAALLAELPQLTLSATPDLSIGVIEGEEPYMFSAPRFTRTLAGDTILVVNGRTSSLRYYTPEGTFLREVGRSGEGPGEYQFIGGLSGLPDGSWIVWDSRQRRITLLEPGGTLRDTWPVRVQGLNENWIGALPDGSVLLQWVWRTPIDPSANRRYLVRVQADGEGVDTLMDTPLNVKEVMRFGSLSLEEPTFEPSPSTATDSSGIWLAPGGGWEVRRLSAEGRLVQILRPHMRRRVMSDEQFAHWADSVSFQGPWPVAERPEVRRIFDRRERNDSIPWVIDVEIGTTGRIWLNEYPFPGVVEDQRWLVLEPDGDPVAWVTVPRHFRPWEFGEDYLLGVARDELDVQYVQRYRLVPGGG